MKNLKLISLSILIFIVSACGKKIHVSEVSMVGNITYYDQQAYTGTVWTDDEQSGKFVTNKGKLTSLTFYHRNGKEAIVMNIDEKTKVPTTEMYNDTGKAIDISEFQQLYMDILVKMEMEMVQEQIK